MSDSFTEVSSESWFSRLGNSIKSVLIGVVLFLVAFPLLWWNEGEAVHVAQGLAELGKEVVSAKAEVVEAANDKKPVHLTAEATTDETLSDATFGISAPAIKLRRKVEMYQWEEEKETKKKKKFGGGTRTETTYSYKQVWSEEPIDSGGFHEKGRAEHQNPAQMRHRGSSLTAKEVKLGAFRLSPGLVKQWNEFKPRPVTDDDLAELPGELPERAQTAISDGRFYVPVNPKWPGKKEPDAAKPGTPAPERHPGELEPGAAAGPKAPKPEADKPEAGQPPAVRPPLVPAEPEIGDMRIAFEVVEPGTVSIMARQIGNTFEPWRSGSGKDFERLEVGTMSAEAMVGKMEGENTIRTWILRLVGFLLMAFGIGMVFSPVAVLADVIPFLGDLLRMGIALFAIVVAAFFSLLTIAIAWLAYRPELAIGLLAAGVGVVVLFKVLGRSKRAATAPVGT